MKTPDSPGAQAALDFLDAERAFRRDASIESAKAMLRAAGYTVVRSDRIRMVTAQTVIDRTHAASKDGGYLGHVRRAMCSRLGNEVARSNAIVWTKIPARPEQVHTEPLIGPRDAVIECAQVFVLIPKENMP